MSEILESLAKSIIQNVLPKLWLSVSYPSLKPLSSYIEDLSSRLTFLNNWINDGPPNIFWISGFFFTQAFLTAALQNFARKHQVPIDAIDFAYFVLDDVDESLSPEDGVYVKGLFIEGARWDKERHELSEAIPKKVTEEMPIVI